MPIAGSMPPTYGFGHQGLMHAGVIVHVWYELQIEVPNSSHTAGSGPEGRPLWVLLLDEVGQLVAPPGGAVWQCR
jgi:hypothetical protein